MKLQIALDNLTLKDSVSLLKDISESVDIIEIGTPLLLEYGMEAVRTIRKLYPHKELLCDAKIIDGGKSEASSAFRAGADYVTVLALSDSATIKAVVAEAETYGKKVVADMLMIGDFRKTVPLLKDTADMLAVHTGVDSQALGRTPLKDLIDIKKTAKNILISVAGGINSDNLNEYIVHNPDVIIVGGGIVNAANPLKEAREIYKRIKETRR